MSSHAMVDVGNDFVLKVARVASGGVCYGIYFVLMALVVSIFARRGFVTRKSNIFLLAVTSLMFIGGTMFFCFDVADLVRRLQIILVEESGQHIGEKLSIADEELKNTFYTGQMLFVFMLILGDSVVVWRTWTICSDLRKWVAAAIATWIGSLLAGLFELGCDIHTHWALDVTTSVASAGAQTCAHADLSSFTLSYVTNILCTLIITFRTWQHRRIMSAYLGQARRKTQVEKVLTLIIESGFFYLVIYTLQAIPIYGAKLDQDGMTAFNVVNAIIQQALGIYPTLVIVLVKMQKSLWDAKEISEVVHSTSIQFTASTRQATTDTMISGCTGHHTQHHSQYTGTTASATRSNTEKGCNRSSMDPEKVEAQGEELDHWEGVHLHQTS